MHLNFDNLNARQSEITAFCSNNENQNTRQLNSFLGHCRVLTFIIRGHKGQNSAETRSRCFLVLDSRCRGFSSTEKMPWNLQSWFLVLESRCQGFFVLESRCRGFLVLESQCRGKCASTTSFSFSLNLLCDIINNIIKFEPGKC